MTNRQFINRIIHGNSLEVLKEIPACSIDSVVTDPPYGIGFLPSMSWDMFTAKQYQEFCYNWGSECLRVLKPGGYLLAFSSCRRYHRMVTGLEDAGFDIQDQIDWVFAGGMIKGLNLSKAIDRHLGMEDEREIIGDNPCNNWSWHGKQPLTLRGKYSFAMLSRPATPEAQQWEGWKGGKQSLKPAHEPIVLAQKPVEGNYVRNVLKYGVGGLNLKGCKIDSERVKTKGGAKHVNTYRDWGEVLNQYHEGRFPPNLVIDKSVASMLDEQCDHAGGCSKFFKIVKNPLVFCPKASKFERDAGLDDIEQEGRGGKFEFRDSDGFERFDTEPQKNDIPTLKPINLFRWLVRLVTPLNGLVLDLFAGSGTTAIGCIFEGFNYLLIEKQEKFAKSIIPRRIEFWSNPENRKKLKGHKELDCTTGKSWAGQTRLDV